MAHAQEAAFVPITLDELAALSASALGELYQAGETPRAGALRGNLSGRMLSLRQGTGLLGRAFRWLAARPWFPWRGKSFSRQRAAAPCQPGEGINLLVSDRRPWRWLRFRTFLGPSREGGVPALQLDYDRRENPFFLRALRDEIRQVAPGLYLGEAFLVTRRRARLVLYFALSTA